MLNVSIEKLFKAQLIGSLIAIFGWSSIYPIIQNNLNLINPVMLSILGIIGLLAGLTQKYFREKYDSEQLVIRVLMADVFYVISLIVLILLNFDLATLILYSTIFGALYMALMGAATRKVDLKYYGQFDDNTREQLDTKYNQYILYAKIIAFVFGGILGYYSSKIFDNLVHIFDLRIIFITLSVVFQIWYLTKEE